MPECPVGAIFPLDEVPEGEKAFIDRNRDFFTGKTEEELKKLRMPA